MQLSTPTAFMRRAPRTPDKSESLWDEPPPWMRRLESPSNIFDNLDFARPVVPPKAIHEFRRRKWSSDKVHGYNKLSELSRQEPAGSGLPTTNSPQWAVQRLCSDVQRVEKEQSAATVLCAAARGRAVRRVLALLHATATYLQARSRLASLGRHVRLTT